MTAQHIAIKYLPFIACFAGCYLKEMRYNISGETYAGYLYHNYSGTGIIAVCIVHGVLVFFGTRKSNMPGPYVYWIPGIVIAGFAIQRLYHIMVLFRGGLQNSKAIATSSAAYPAEGLILLLLGSIAMIAFGFVARRNKFSTPVE